MSGRVIVTAEHKHACNPGWETRVAPEDSQPFGGGLYSVPPSPENYPPGTVWQCDCGKTWVSTGPVAWNSPGIIGFRREHWWEFRRRVLAASRSRVRAK